jgi:peptidoglycan/LPS O-acetylase OafA/YrhL
MTYRADIDGLRAIAVLAVIFYHFHLLTGFGGGYVGVDIFFVISGYLIGGIIIDETANGTFSYTRFYTRRIKRLFAAFMVVGVAAMALGWWLLLPADYKAEAKSLVASTVFLSNVIFYRDAGYFDAASVTKPLLHTWSLGVEEQFYLFFPLLMRLAVRSGRMGVPIMLSVAGLLSLVNAQHLLAVDPTASFYLLPPRAWELLLGAAVAQPLIRELSVPAPLIRMLNYVALAAVLFPIVFYSDATPFPGLTALPCCIGTAWLLWSGRCGTTTLIQKGLSARIPVGIGRISYSLYLWHWPIYVFIAYYQAGEIGWLARSVALSLTFGFAFLSWRLVEQPIRYSRLSPPAVFVGAFIGSCVLAGLGYAIWRSDGAPKRLSEQTRAIAYAAEDFFKPANRCWPDGDSALPDVSYCRIGAVNTPDRFLVWGDSHARAIRDGLDQVATEHGLGGLLVYAGGCMPAFDMRKQESATGPRSDNACAAQNTHVKAMLARPNGIKKVLLVGRWAYYSEGQGVGMDRQNLIQITPANGSAGSAHGSRDQAAIFAQALTDTVHWLRERGYEVYLLEDSPEIPDFSSRKLFQVVRGGHASVQDSLTNFGTVARSEVERRQQHSEEAMKTAAAQEHATILTTRDLFCHGEYCSAWSGSRPVYFDNNHITGTTSRSIREVYLPAM